MPTSNRYQSIFAPDCLRDDVVLVAGGGTGIGRCIAHEVAALGARTLIAGRRKEALDATAAEIVDAGGRVDVLPMNIRDEESVGTAVAVAVKRHGQIHACVNSAGGQFYGPAADFSSNGWRSVVDLNLTGSFLLCKALFDSSMKDHGGAIVSIVAAHRNGMPGLAHSGAARAGVSNLTKSLAIEWAEHGIRLNAVAPGLIHSTRLASYSDEQLRDAEARSSRIPAGRIGTESEVSAAAVFLLTKAAAFITGQTLYVDGGTSLVPQISFAVPPASGTQAFRGFHLSRQSNNGSEPDGGVPSGDGVSTVDR